MTTIERTRADVTVDLDFYDPTIAAPVDRFNDLVADLAAINPVVYSTAHGGHWIVLGYEEITQVLRDPTTYSSYPNNLVTNEAFGKFIPIELDPPEHTAYRRALAPLFTPKRMSELREMVRETVNELIDGFAKKGEAEFVAEFAHELPARVFLALMDWPVEDAPLFTEATDIVLFGKPGGTEEESLQARAMAGFQMFGYFQKIIEDRRANPGHDVTSTIVHTEVALPDGKRLLTDEELNRMCFLLLVAGLHTVQGSLAWAVKHLVENPEQRKLIIDDPGEVLPTAVEEILRIDSAIIAGRSTTREVQLGGMTIPEGDQLVVVLGAANRDGRQFEDPTRLDVLRKHNRHLAFGGGPHQCLGMHLARIEMNIALEELLRRIPDFDLVAEDPPTYHSSQVRGCARMPIRFTPES